MIRIEGVGEFGWADVHGYIENPQKRTSFRDLVLDIDRKYGSGLGLEVLTRLINISINAKEPIA